VGVLLCQVEHNCNRLGENKIVVNEYWNPACWINLEEVRAMVFARREVDGYSLEIYAEFLERLSHPNRSRRSKFIESHIVLLSSGGLLE
jgi:hypothetical protein